MWNKLVMLNERLNDLLRKAAIVVIMLSLIAVLSFLFPYVAPFVVAALFAAMIEPVVRLLSRLMRRIKFARTIASALCTILILAVLLFVTLTLSSRILSEITSIAAALPRLASDLVGQSTAWFNSRLPAFELLDDSTRGYLLDSLTSLGKTITASATTFASTLARGVWNTATVTVPQVMLFITLTFMGTFYFSADRERIISMLVELVPPWVKRSGALVKANLFRGLFSQIRASLILMCITFVNLSIGFTVIGIDYAILAALVICLLDALPILGAGLFLVPMSLYGFFTGNFRTGVGMLLLYIINGIIYQTLQPRLIGRHMGLHPLATMMAMYASYRVIGFIGMIVGPIILLLCKVIVELASEPTLPAVSPSMAPDAAIVSPTDAARQLKRTGPKKKKK